jgi:hypothetical protein
MGRKHRKKRTPKERERLRPRQKHLDIDDFAKAGSFTVMDAPGPEDYPELGPPPMDPMTFTPTSAHYGRKAPEVRRELDRGKTVLCEVLLVAVMMVLGLAGVAGQFVVDRWTTTYSYRSALAQELLDDTVKAVHAYSFDALADLDEFVVYDSGNPKYSDFKVEIAVAQAKGDKLCIKTVLRDTRTLATIAERVIYRSPS